MSNEFDPYYNWLGISPDEQPADHYRLLAIRRYESNTDVISNASDQRMGHIRTFQTGKRAAESQRILNELAAATRCLLDPEQKKKYDTQLKAQLDAKKAAAAPKAAVPVAAVPVAAKPVAKPAVARAVAPQPIVAAPEPIVAPVQPSVEQQPALKVEARRKKSTPIAAYIMVGGGLLLVVGMVSVGGAMLMMRPKPAPAVVVNPVPNPPPAPEQPAEKPPEKETPKPDVEKAVPTSDEKIASSKEKPTPTPVSTTPFKDTRKLWKAAKANGESNGLVREVSAGKWEEVWHDGRTMHFDERERNEKEIVLFDKNRSMWVRLSNTALHFRRDGTASWILSHAGSWVDESSLASNSNSGDSNTSGNIASKPLNEQPTNGPPARKITLGFNGKAKATIDTKNAPWLDLEKPFTLEFWYRHRGSFSDSPGLLHCGDLQLYLAPGAVDSERGRSYAMGVESNVVSSNEINLDRQWHHVAIVRNGEKLSLFVDGRHQFNLLFDKLNLSSLTPVVFGEATNAENNVRNFTGEVRSVRFAPTALYASQKSFTPPESIGFQIAGDVNLKPDGVNITQGHLDDNLASQTPSGSNPSGSPSSTNSAVVGTIDAESMKEKRDLILVFDGNSKITLDTPEPVLELGKPCTIEYWFRRTETTEQFIPLLKFADVSTMLHNESETRVNFDVFRRSSGGGGQAPLGPKEWHHIVYQTDTIKMNEVDTPALQIWLDGRFATRVPLQINQESGPLTPVEIGKGNRFANGVAFKGEIRSLKIVRSKLYPASGPGVLDYDSYEHGIYIPQNVSLNMSGVKTRATDGGIVPRNSLSSLTKTKPTERLPPPDKELLDAAKATVATVYGAKIKAANKPEQKLELGQEILKTSISEKDNALAYALLGEARTQALGSLNVNLLLEVVTEVERRFTVDRLVILSKLLPEMNNTKLLVDQREILVGEALKTAATALSEEKITIANDLSELATNAVKVSKSVDLKKAVRASREHILAVKLIYDDAQKALATLAQNADDADANLVAGKYYVLGMENFEKGLPYLAKAGNSALAVAAQREVKAKTKEERCAVAEAWYEAAASMKGAEKLTLQRHVAAQYEAVKDEVTGILQAKAKERLAELKPILEEADKAKQVVAKSTNSKKPVPGLIYRVISGYGNAAIPTPYLGVALNRQDLSRSNYYQYTKNYPGSSSASFQLVGLVVVEKDMEVLLTLSDCVCVINNQDFDTRSQAITNQRVPMKKGSYPIVININGFYSSLAFQINRADTGESLLFHNEEIFDAQMNIPAALANGLPSKGIRIDGLKSEN